jgi:hypothetical protein
MNSDGGDGRLHHHEDGDAKPRRKAEMNSYQSEWK